MRPRLRSLPARLLPNGWGDVLRQIVLFCGAYWLYRLVRGLVDGRAAEAFAHARQIVSLERSLGLFVEPSVHAWARGHEAIIDFASWMYVNSHFVITVVALAWLYLRRNARFYFIRNMFMVAMGIALVGYVLYPTAPPRFLPELGFTDSVADFTGVKTGVGADTDGVDVLFNPFAAVPSMHVAFSLMLAGPMLRMVRRPWAKALWALYPALITFVVVSTANHWWFDAVTGALTAAVAAVAAHWLFARARPEVWAFDPARSAAAA
jgi:membrane-associated phospholipid phosphatase